ncbi:MAG: hypothetical protein A2W91_04400 [Bacteroidetes bacterium GWF2_38_335]|nr:MAG: hypothetical protein A2W91_04400 [Bacteroidetes bacterium GWF2_38_335]HBS88252.1 hypothetical protein [Bacteroidales bacterium]
MLTILYTAIFIFLIYKLKWFRLEGVSRRVLSGIFIIKILAGTMMMLIYTHYYKTRENADIFKYFDDGKIIYKSLSDNPSDYFSIITGIGSDSEHLEKYYSECSFWHKSFNYELFNDNRTVIRFNAIVMLFSFGYFSVHTVFMAFLSFLGLFAVFKILLPFMKNKKWLLIAGLFFIPSVLLHSSSVLKEGLLMFNLGFLFYFVYKLSTENKRIALNMILISILFLFMIIVKLYVLIAVIPGLIILFVFNRFGTKFHFIKFAAIHLLIILLALNSKYIIPPYDFPLIMAQKQKDFITYTNSLDQVGSKIYLPPIEPTATSIVANCPNALYNAAFRPHLFEADTFMMLLSALENTVFLLFFILCIVFGSFKKIRSFPLLYFAISFTLILFCISGLTTPVLGALVRYKSPALPFLFMGLSLILDYDKLIGKLSYIFPFLKPKSSPHE